MRKWLNGQYVDMTQEEIEELENFSGGVEETNSDESSDKWRTIRNFTIQNEEGLADDESDITWTVDDDGNITAFEFSTDDNGKSFNAEKMRMCIYPDDWSAPIFGGAKGYLNIRCNGYNSVLYNATSLANGYRLETQIQSDLSGILRQVAYMGADRNSYGNEKPHVTFFNTPGEGYGKPPVNNLKVACNTGIYFTTNAHVIVQICEVEE